MLLLIRFSRRRLRAFVMPSFLLHVFAKLPLIFSLESGCIGGGYLNEIRLCRGIFIYKVRHSDRKIPVYIYLYSILCISCKRKEGTYAVEAVKVADA